MTIIFYSFVSVIYDVCVRHCLHKFSLPPSVHDDCGVGVAVDATTTVSILHNTSLYMVAYKQLPCCASLYWVWDHKTAVRGNYAYKELRKKIYRASELRV